MTANTNNIIKLNNGSKKIGKKLNKIEATSINADADANTNNTESVDNKVTDLYSVLEVSRDATPDEIKENYLRLALLHHPDKGGDKNKFKEIATAYKILSDEKKKSKYDSSLANTYLDLIKTSERDINYHKSDKYIKSDGNGKDTFDADAFNRAFNESRNYNERDEFEELLKPLPVGDIEDNKDVMNTFENILKARQMEEDILISREESLAFMQPDGKMDNDAFVRIFNEKKRKESRALADYDPNNCMSHNSDTFNNYLIGMESIFGKERKDPISDSNYIISDMFTDSNAYKMDDKASVSDLTARIEQMRAEQEYLFNIPKDDYIIDPNMVDDDLAINENE